MNTPDNRPIRPELLAQKLAKVCNFELPEIAAEIEAEPRLREALWFLQWVSVPENFAGGLRRFSEVLIAASADLLGSDAMRAGGRAVYALAEARAIVQALPMVAQDRLGIGEGVTDALARMSELADHGSECIEWDRAAWEAERAEQLRSAQRRQQAREEKRHADVTSLTPEKVLRACEAAAREELGDYLRALCERPDARFTREKSFDEFRGGRQAPWYFPRVAEAILRFLDGRKAAIAERIAETEITREVFRWLGKAASTRKAVMIEGNSRFGKTEAVRTWCGMNAGRARIVETPAAHSESDFLRAVARALGIELGPKQRGVQLREEIEYVLRYSGLMLIFDESQFLWPSNFSRNTAPARLNWIRREIMDAGLPAAFIATPQSYQSAKRRFVKATSYAIEQFDERILKTVRLPLEVGREDLLAIARVHFPELPAQYLEYVVSTVAATERNYVSDVEKIAVLARDNATEAGRKRPNLADVKAAIADVLPARPVAAVEAARQSPCKTLSEPVQSLGIDEAPAREIAPPGTRRTAAADSDFSLPAPRGGLAVTV